MIIRPSQEIGSVRERWGGTHISAGTNHSGVPGPSRRPTRSRTYAAYAPQVLAVINVSSFAEVIGCIAVVGWVADQTLRDLQEIRRARQRRRP
jgi:hypothetical protein